MQINVIIEALEGTVKAYELGSLDHNKGLCEVMARAGDFKYASEITFWKDEILFPAFRRWRLFSGLDNYPVPPSKFLYEEAEADGGKVQKSLSYRTEDLTYQLLVRNAYDEEWKYKGLAGKARIDLARHLLRVLPAIYEQKREAYEEMMEPHRRVEAIRDRRLAKIYNKRILEGIEQLSKMKM